MIDSQVGNRPELRRTLLGKLELLEVQEMEDKGWSASDYKEGYKLMTWKERNKDIRKLAQLVVIRRSSYGPRNFNVRPNFVPKECTLRLSAPL
jgi:hypothetical protein